MLHIGVELLEFLRSHFPFSIISLLKLLVSIEKKKFSNKYNINEYVYHLKKMKFNSLITILY